YFDSLRFPRLLRRALVRARLYLLRLRQSVETLIPNVAAASSTVALSARTRSIWRRSTSSRLLLEEGDMSAFVALFATASGRAASWTVPLSQKTAAASIAFRSSRTLPGQP